MNVHSEAIGQLFLFIYFFASGDGSSAGQGSTAASGTAAAGRSILVLPRSWRVIRVPQTIIADPALHFPASSGNVHPTLRHLPSLLNCSEHYRQNMHVRFCAVGYLVFSLTQRYMPRFALTHWHYTHDHCQGQMPGSQQWIAIQANMSAVYQCRLTLTFVGSEIELSTAASYASKCLQRGATTLFRTSFCIPHHRASQHVDNLLTIVYSQL